MMLFKKIFYLLSSEERKNAAYLLIMVLVMALLDVIGVVSIVPFMAVLSNPQLVETSTILNNLFQYSVILGVENKKDFLFFLGFFVFILLVLSLSFKGLTTYFQYRFVTSSEYSIGKRMIEGYFKQPYAWFLNRNSADLGKSILSEVGLVISKGVQPALNLITHSVLVFFLVAILIYANPKLALTVGLVLGGSYYIVYKLVREFLTRLGEERLILNEIKYKSVIEAFVAIKEIKVGGFEQKYTKRFAEPAKKFARITSLARSIADLPRFILEAISFGGMLLLILFLMKQSNNFVNIVPLISLYAFTGYRLMPSLQNIYGAMADLRFIGPAVNALYNDMIKSQKLSLNSDQGFMQFNENITLNDICYNYPNTSRTALKNINLNISARSMVGLVGTTGSGKTTTVDIILGLLEPQKGVLKVDNQIISKNNCRDWHRSIGYVPQQIYLSDDTIAANIAFGIDPKNMDLKTIEWAAKIANLHDFVVDELPKKYQTIIGERGVRLSGGQRQRIGIARALYAKPNVLILDEATNALDYITESEVMDAIHNIHNDITIIIITHRLSTVKKCDNIFLLEKGQIKKQGKYFDVIDEEKTSL